MTKEERDLLVSAAADGRLIQMEARGMAPFVSTTNDAFGRDTDPAVAALYVDALDQLVRQGLARHVSGSIYGLTGEGFKTARALKG